MTAPGPAGPPTPTPVPAAVGAPVDAAPEPPPGPGVRPPFAAPPTEGRTARLWIGLGVAGLAVLLCCGGGLAALFGLAVTGTEAINERARVVIGDYLDAVREGEYRRAYGLLCEPARRRESPQAFERRVSAEPKIRSYRIGDALIANDIVVPVEVTYERGVGQRTLRVVLTQNSRTGEFEICGIR